jgi:hypothetical protein
MAVRRRVYDIERIPFRLGKRDLPLRASSSEKWDSREGRITGRSLKGLFTAGL